MLVLLRGLGMESKDVSPGVILVVPDLSVYGPEVAVNVEKVHIDGYLDTFLEKIFLLEHLFHYDHLAVRHGGYQAAVLRVRRRACGNPEEPGDENHKHNQCRGDGYAYPQVVDEVCVKEDEYGADTPACEDGAVRVRVNSDPFHTSPNVAR